MHMVATRQCNQAVIKRMEHSPAGPITVAHHTRIWLANYLHMYFYIYIYMYKGCERWSRCWIISSMIKGDSASDVLGLSTTCTPPPVPSPIARANYNKFRSGVMPELDHFTNRLAQQEDFQM